MRQYNMAGAAQPPEDLLCKDIVQQNPSLLEVRTSYYERHNLALYVRSSLLARSATGLPKTANVARGDIGYIHPDLSIHLYFSPPDAKMIIQKGWGERHRLARQHPRQLVGAVSCSD
jgi:Family of unknown function (DUF5519)